MFNQTYNQSLQQIKLDLRADEAMLQKEDVTLEPWWQKVTEIEGGRCNLCLKKGIFYQCKGTVKTWPFLYNLDPK